MNTTHVETSEHLHVSMFEMQSCARGYHVYQNVWSLSVEVLSCEKGSKNCEDPYTVATNMNFTNNHMILMLHLISFWDYAHVNPQKIVCEKLGICGI